MLQIQQNSILISDLFIKTPIMNHLLGVSFSYPSVSLRPFQWDLEEEISTTPSSLLYHPTSSISSWN